MDGYQATKEIRKFFYKYQLKQPIISAVTGHTEDYYVKKCYDSGMNQILSKPVKKELLNSLIKKIRSN